MENRETLLYQTESCFYCHRVREKLAELGLPYRTVNVPRNRAQRDELFDLSQQRGVPTLVDGDVIIRDDDDAIIAYLEKRYSAPAGHPDKIKKSASA